VSACQQLRCAGVRTSTLTHKTAGIQGRQLADRADVTTRRRATNLFLAAANIDNKRTINQAPYELNASPH